MRTIILGVLRSTAIFSVLMVGTVFSQQCYHCPSNPFQPPERNTGQTLPPAPRQYVTEVSPVSRTAPPPVMEDKLVPVSPQAPIAKDEKKSNSMFSWFSRKPKSDKAEQEDDGLEKMDAINKERRYSEQENISSETALQGTEAKDQYLIGIGAERQGNYGAAVQAYQHFIRANKSRTQTGILAAPYHRLAVIAWKQWNNTRNAETYFRYALKYAHGAMPFKVTFSHFS